MNLRDIITKVGGSVLKNAVPGGAILVDVVNEFLPNSKKLSGEATGHEIRDRVADLPPGLQATVYGKEFDVDLARVEQGNATLRSMLDAEVESPHSTRPFIAKGAFLVVAFVIITCVLVWAYGALTNKPELVTVVTQGWPFVLAAIGPLAVLLRAYFGVLQTEQSNRLNAATGQAAGGLITKLLRGL